MNNDPNFYTNPTPIYLFSFYAAYQFNYGGGSSYGSNNAILEHLTYTTHYYLEKNGDTFNTEGLSISMPFYIALG